MRRPLCGPEYADIPVPGPGRTLSLYYNSAASNNLTLIPGTVAEPNTIAMPTSIRVVVVVTVPGGQQFKDSTTYSPPTLNPVCTTAPCAPYSDPQQFVVGRGLSNIGTGYYPATLTVRNIYPSATLDSTVSGFVIVVNRKSSFWGRGWSLLGLETFAIDPTDTTRGILWDGDNSVRVYRKPVGQPNSLVFYGAAGDAPDSLVRFDTLGVKWYRRGQRHGAAVLLDETGVHRVTRNRAGQATVFTYGLVGGKSRLVTITVPPKRASPLTYSLTWNAATGRLDSIVDPAGRRMVLTIGTDTLLSKIQIRSVGDPITYETRFTYSGNRMVTRAVVRPDTFPGHLATTSYAYANSARLTSATIPYDTLSSGRTAVTTFTPWDERGLTVLVLADTAGLPTRVNGPIAGTGDAADILIERLGGAKRIVGLGLNDTTAISRTDATNPGLVTKIVYPNKRTITMQWNIRANLDSLRDSWQCSPTPCDTLPTKITAYTYGDQVNAPDSPTRVQDALLRHSDFTYDSLGLTTQATDTRGHRTKFYNRTASADTLRGLVDSVAEVNVLTWIEAVQAESLKTLVTRFHYDSTTGNLLWFKSPLGVVTSYRLDAAGNVTDVVDPMRTRTTFAAYDLWNRVGEIDRSATIYMTYPPFDPLTDCVANQIVCTNVLPDGGGTQVERYYLNVVGLDSTSDARGVKRRFGSDALGRVWRETDELGNSRRVFFNALGAVDSSRSRSGISVKYRYDTLGRLTTRFWPTVSGFGLPDSVQSDSLRFSYDIMGNVLTAQGRFSGGTGTITRTYYGDNSIHTRVTTYGGTDSLRYFYDATGARTRVIHWAPRNSIRDSVLYTYSSTGDLASIRAFHTGASPDSQVFTFLWDSLGRRRQVTYPNGATVTFAYDGGGTVRRILGTGTGRFNFSLRDSLVDPAGNIGVEKATCHLLSGDTFGPGSLCGGVGPQTITSTFNRLGEVIKQVFSGQDNRTDSMKYDASGNLTFRRRSTETPTDRLWSIVANSNRLAKEAFLGDTFGFTPDGSRRYASQGSTFTEKYWYDGLGRTSGVAVTGNEAHLGPNQCKYDPDGQMYKPCDDDAPLLAFDGANVVTAFSDEWRFVAGPGVDDPLVGLVRLSPSGSRRLYFITDGNGRQLMVTDSSGALNINDQPAPGYPRGDWRYGGATSAANTFSGDRISPPNLPTVSLFRNRVYDQKSGRWTQEDPMGVEGGLNQYRYNGNNPVAFTDPFGLQCPIRPNECPFGYFAAAGSLLGAGIGAGTGGVTGATAGAIGGASLCAPSGPGAALCAAGGAALGGTAGAVTGARVGAVIGGAIGITVDVGNILFSRGESRQIGEAIRDVAGKRANTPESRRDVGRYLEEEKAAGRVGSKNTKGDFTFEELKRKVREFFGIDQ